MSLEAIFARITDEMTRAVRLQDAGKIKRVPMDPESTNIECANTLAEEVDEVLAETIGLLSCMIGLQKRAGAAVRTVNDLEEILWRWHLDPPERIDEADRAQITMYRARLAEELTQVAAVATSWLVRLEDEEHRHLSRLRDGQHLRSAT